MLPFTIVFPLLCEFNPLEKTSNVSIFLFMFQYALVSSVSFGDKHSIKVYDQAAHYTGQSNIAFKVSSLLKSL